jgi:ABC-2 type transport system ATP-binding protein
MREDLAGKRGKTVFLATHNLYEAQQICDRVALIRKGMIIASGTPEQIRRAVANTTSLSISLTGIASSEIDAFLSGMKNINGITTVSAQEVGNELRLSAEGTRDLDYEGLFSYLNREGARIISLEAMEPSLEEAFLSIVGGKKD